MQLIHPNGQSLTLSDDLLWTDEFAWSSLAQTEPERTLSGSYIVQQGIKQAGRPITLSSPENMAWHTRATVETLQQWAMLPESTFTLNMPQGSFTVLFANDGVSAKPVLDYGGTHQDDYFTLTLKLITAL